MKISILLFVAVFLINTKMSFGDTDINNFNEYVNSPADSSENPINKEINTNTNHTGRPEAAVHSDKKDTQVVLQGIPAQWQVCSKDTDCTAVVADCVSWDAINKKHLRALLKNLRSCSESIDPGFQPDAVCAAKVCKTTEKTTGVSWEEWYHMKL